MNWHNRVIWSEGMFIRPQHFQQSDRYSESLLKSRTSQIMPYNWGISSIAFDEDALRVGKLLLRQCTGVFPDGMPFDMPNLDAVPDPIEITSSDEGSIVYIGLPLWRAGANDVDRKEYNDANARYRVQDAELPDIVVGSDSLAVIEVGSKNIQLLRQSQVHHQYAAIPVARIQSCKNQQVVLDSSYIPPLLDCAANSALKGFIEEIYGLLMQRGSALADRIKSAVHGGAAEMADFLLLQLTNRYEPLFFHYTKCPKVHPLHFYETAIQLAGELAAFTHESKRYGAFSEYDHEDLERTFEEVIAELRRSLSSLLEQNAINIALEEKGYGIRVGVIPDPQLLKATFILAVKSDMPREEMRKQFPLQVKIGPVEHINNLVNRQLPGIKIEALPVVPRQIPYYSGTVYFELESSGYWWEALGQSGGIALHIGTQFPGINLELWAIKQ
ncbi:MAG: type VI secretion system baseplate subunit TssK [Chromatiales bacterium]|nr:type VI secretion system baseplate subunit TssK [Chromatiales bacterium]